MVTWGRGIGLVLVLLDAAGCGGCGQLPPAVMVEVPGGAFQMGCNAAVDTACAADEYPYHEVTLAAFQIDQTEVTQAAYQECLDATACTRPALNFDPRRWARVPVSDVTFAQASAYCRWAEKRLPTEAEWEKAARGTDGRKYPWGDTAPTCALANMSGCRAPEPVGSHPAGASPYGALDMAGNVGEWVADWYDPGYYSASPLNDPPGPSAGTEKLARGGSLGASARFLRTSSREHFAPTFTDLGIGFRCAR